jgi:hypothetical protein
MDVVCGILRIVELNDERGSLYAVIVRLIAIDPARPGEVNILSGTSDLFFPPFHERCRQIARVLLR